MELSKLQPRLEKANVALVGMLHENIPREVEDFREFLKVTNHYHMRS